MGTDCLFLIKDETISLKCLIFSMIVILGDGANTAHTFFFFSKEYYFTSIGQVVSLYTVQ